MLRQTFACDVGLLYHSDTLAEHGLDVGSLWPVLIDRKAPSVGPAPTALDLYAAKELPSLAVRRDTFRRQSLLSALSETNYDTSSSLTTLADKGINQASSKSTIKSQTSSNITSVEILPEHHEDYFDSLSPINDQLKVSWPWWILEILPIKYRVKTGDGLGWKKKVGPNRGRHRTIRDVNPNVHWTVMEREKAAKYKIKCPTDGDVQWSVAY